MAIILISTGLATGCGNQTRVVEVTATPEPGTAVTSETAAALSFVDSGQRLGNGRSWDVSLGDLDGDGDLDAFVANGQRGEKESTVWFNDGRGTFTAGKQPLGYGMGVSLGDLDGDGDLDAFIVSWDEPGKVWLNDGDGTFRDTGQSLGDAGGWDVALGDLDGDGDLDALVARDRANTVWLNDGTGIFADTDQRLGETYSAAAGLGDLDGDGDLDALTVGWDEPGKVWLNDGTGAFTDSGQALTPRHIHIHGMTLGDVDSDGDLDAFMAGAPNQIWFNDGGVQGGTSGVFHQSEQRLDSLAGDTVALGDLDGDGDLDIYLAVGDRTGSDDKVWLNDGGAQGGTPGQLTDSSLSLSTDFSSGIGLGDLDGDGDLDAFVAHGELGEASGGEIPNEVWLNGIIPAPTSDDGEIGEIAFVSERDGIAQIYLMNADGSEQRPLTQASQDHWYPHWSPDGERIAFHSHQSNNVWSIYTIDAQGGDLQRLTHEEAHDAGPVWSPDGAPGGAQLAFDRDFDLWIMDVDGSNLRRITDDPGIDGHADWSPDGSHIVFTSERDGNPELYIMDVVSAEPGSGDLRRLTYDDGGDWWPDWSPDGTMIAFKSDRDGDFEIYVMAVPDGPDVDGTALRQLTDNDAEDGEPDWSPDGTRIAFESNRDGGFDIYVMDVDNAGQGSGNVQRLTDHPARDIMPVWQPEFLAAEPPTTESTSLEPNDTGTVTDADGNVYPIIQIGDQWWMAANLNVTSDPDGEPITGRCYDDDEENCEIYGRLYTWDTTMNGSTEEGAPGICPLGWHIPGDAEWQELINCLGGESVAGGRMKETGVLHWSSPNTGATNESEFNALPTGFLDFTGEFRGLGEVCILRTSSSQDPYEVYVRELTSAGTSITRGGIHPDDAIPIRCVKD
jgi:uncharacterized protein (TIGR02145 family)